MINYPFFYEKLEVKRFCNKSIDLLLDELWSQMFENTYATDENVVTLSMDPNVDDEVVDGEEGDKEINRKDNYYERDRGVVYIRNIIDVLLK